MNLIKSILQIMSLTIRQPQNPTETEKTGQSGQNSTSVHPNIAAAPAGYIAIVDAYGLPRLEVAR